MRTIVPASLIVAACQGTGPADEPAEDVRAVITERTPAGIAALRGAIETALPGRRILLADDALEESSLLVVERRGYRRLEGSPVTGVPDQTPQRFRLVLADGPSSPRRPAAAARPEACELVHLNTGKRYPLPTTRCRAERQPAQ